MVSKGPTGLLCQQEPDFPGRLAAAAAHMHALCKYTKYPPAAKVLSGMSTMGEATLTKVLGRMGVTLRKTM